MLRWLRRLLRRTVLVGLLCASSLVAGGAREGLIEVAELCFAPDAATRSAVAGGEA